MRINWKYSWKNSMLFHVLVPILASQFIANRWIGIFSNSGYGDQYYILGKILILFLPFVYILTWGIYGIVQELRKGPVEFPVSQRLGEGIGAILTAVICFALYFAKILHG